MIEVFKTNVREHGLATELAALLQQHFPGSKINFDLEDCDKVLRIEGDHISTEKIKHLLHTCDCSCEVLE
jgi:hypothetical protein